MKITRGHAYQLAGRQPYLNPENKLLIYKVIREPIWMYGIELRGTAADSRIKKIGSMQSIIHDTVVNGSRYVDVTMTSEKSWNALRTSSQLLQIVGNAYTLNLSRRLVKAHPGKKKSLFPRKKSAQVKRARENLMTFCHNLGKISFKITIVSRVV